MEGGELHSDVKPSLPQLFTMYLSAQVWAASRASKESCSHSSETMLPHSRYSSIFCLLLPHVKDADLGIKDTSVEVRLWIWLVLMIPVTWVVWQPMATAGWHPKGGALNF